MEMDVAAIFTLLDQPQRLASGFSRAQQRLQKSIASCGMIKSAYILTMILNAGDNLRSTSSRPFIRSGRHCFTEQAARVAANLSIFERNGGLQTSDRNTGGQWDARLVGLRCRSLPRKGLRRYGFSDAADRIATKFFINDYARFCDTRDSCRKI
jgi:hypothetical protein